MSATTVAVVGAGPYGLSVAAHLRERRIPFRIFGSPFVAWREHMPEGMFLKSEGFASSLSDPRGRYTLRRFAEETGRPYADIGLPVPLETFVAYGDWFRSQAVPDVEEVEVERIEGAGQGFVLTLSSGEDLQARRVVVAAGVGPFTHVPPELHGAGPAGSHAYDHASLAEFRGADVAVVGAGQSALETAVLLHEAGARPWVVARCPQLAWNPPPAEGERRTWLTTGLGRRWKFKLYLTAPSAFRRLPDARRAQIVRTALGPAGAWWLRDRFTPVRHRLGTRVVDASPNGAGVVLTLNGGTADDRLEVAQVIAATGYRVDVDRLGFLAVDLRGRIRRAGGSPRLNGCFESTVPGLYFVGLAAADSFGPAMRFVFGSDYAARRVARAVA